MSNNSTISQIAQSLTTPSDRTLVEVEVNGQSYKMELGALAAFLAARTPSEPQAATPYWINFPGYVLDSGARTVAVNGAGRYFREGAESNAAARTLTFASIQTAGQKRFDAIVYDLNAQQYTIIAGQEGAQPTTPGIDTRFHLRVTFILVDDNGGQLQTPPNDHVQNTDQRLDQGGTNEVTAQELRQFLDNPSGPGTGHTQNTDIKLAEGTSDEVSAADLKAALDKLGYFAGYFPTEADLITQTTDAYALVGSPIGLWVYQADTDTWSLPTAGTSPGSGGDAASTVSYAEPYTFQFYSDLDTVSAEITLFGPKEFVNPEISPKLTGLSYQVKLTSTNSYTAQTDLTALNAWITANVTTSTTAYDLRLIADYGTSTGAASATIYETKTLTAA